MDPNIVFCNKCYTSLQSSRTTSFYLTSCGNVFCQKCIPSQSSCDKCGRNCSRKLISSQMSPDVSILFKDLNAEIKRLQNAIGFQMARYKLSHKYINAKMANMERALQGRDAKIRTLEVQNNALQIGYNKLNESNHVSVNQYQSPGGHKSNFANTVMNAIRDQQFGNESITSQGNASGIFPREPIAPPRVHFENSFTPNNRPITQSTPIVGHEQIGLRHFGIIRNNKPSSSIISTRYRR